MESKDMKILIIDGFHDSDRGGAGIIAGLVSTLYKIARESGKTIEIGLVYRYSEDDAIFRSAARHTKKAFPDIKIYGTPIRTFRKNTGLLGKIDFLSILLHAFLKLLFPSLFSDKVVRAMKNADIVISKGGHFYQSNQKSLFNDLIYSFLSYYNLLLVIRLRKKFALIAHSVGPFNNYVSKKLTKLVFKKGSLLGTREQISKNILVGMGIEESIIEVIPDTAFALTPADKNDLNKYLDKKGLKETKYAIFTPRYWDFETSDAADSDTLYRNYLRSSAEIADYLIEAKYADKILLVVHNDGQHVALEDDSKPVNEIFRAIRNKQEVMVIDDDLPPEMQSTLYGNAVITVGTRMHSVIFALVGGGPAIAISYNHKTEGIMKMLGLEKYVLSIDTIDLSTTKEMIQILIAEEARVMENVTAKIQEFRFIIEKSLKKVIFTDDVS
ncbi:MAG: hypothetical protein GY777_12815 [Candidatus Brocadiaceae bacterium]|nr:hypothetical protein [Candidatus Brocadiaceae bacterium]